MTTLESVHHPEAAHRIAFVAWIAVMAVELTVHGIDLVIMGSDAGLLGSVAFFGVALVMITVKALGWSSGWNELGWLFAIIGVCLMILFASAVYDLAQPLPSEVKHSETYLAVKQQLDTNNMQLNLQDLSKESRLALLASNEKLTAQLAILNQADLDALKPHLTLRSMFESIASLPSAPLAKWLCIILFGMIGVGLEVTNFRITPRRATAALPQPAAAEPPREGGLTSPSFINERILQAYETNPGQTPRPSSNDITESKEQTSEHQKETQQPESEARGEEVRVEAVAEARHPELPAGQPPAVVSAPSEFGAADRVDPGLEQEVGHPAEGARAEDVLVGPGVPAAEQPAASDVPGDRGQAFSFPLTGDQLRKFAHMMLRRYPTVRTIDETLEKNPHVPRDVLVALYQRLTGLESGQAKYFRWDGEQGCHVANYERRILDRKLETIE